ncbi:TetR/AcrR family transcriptional regulator [Bacteroides sp. 224]|uniref:TetR/AcrR family transcriptional regulator n=1 Tax=Bacteroides sp. 224 TaxID=2302936 RepID=UPI0013D08717|nr:TetR/AcrR family transcriptional regulator [Bacteroides sp. 224]NDV65071.1 TetR/AcrR family transcriptional regulator [Bacteroides sp. 224]
MEDFEKKSNKRVRRTNKDIEKSIMNATKGMIEDYGLFCISITELAERAITEPPVIYRWYNNLEGLFAKYLETYTFWLPDIIDDISGKNNMSDKEIIKRIFKDIINNLYKDKVLHRVFAWEVADDSNLSTNRLKSKEFAYCYIADEFLPQSSKTVISPMLAIILGGIYYIALTKDKTLCWGIDFSKHSGKKRLIELADRMIELAFSEQKASNEALEIAKKMKNKGIDNKTIVECTGLSISKVQTL